MILYGHVPQAMIAASDRRLINVHTGELLSDTTNKVVIYPGMSFHYTGLAKIDGKPADQWLCDMLRCQDRPKTAFRHVRDQATRAFAQIRLARALKRHAFIGVGWASEGNDLSASEPLVVIISNFVGDGEWLSEARDEFDFKWGLLSRGLPPIADPEWFIDIRTAGQSPSPQGIQRLRSHVRLATKRGVGPPGAARMFAEEIRRQARLPNSRVGAGCLITVHPHPVLTKGNNWLLRTELAPSNPKGIGEYFNALKPDCMSYLYIPANINNSTNRLPERPLIADVATGRVVFDVREIP